MAAMIGVMMSATSAVTTAPNAPPMTTATARSTTLPRMMNSLKPLSMENPNSLDGRALFRGSLGQVVDDQHQLSGRGPRYRDRLCATADDDHGRARIA